MALGKEQERPLRNAVRDVGRAAGPQNDGETRIRGYGDGRSARLAGSAGT